MQQTTPMLAFAEVLAPAINKTAVLINTTAKRNIIGLAPNIGMPVSKNQAATMILSRSSPKPTPPPGNREYSLSIVFSSLIDLCGLADWMRFSCCVYSHWRNEQRRALCSPDNALGGASENRALKHAFPVDVHHQQIRFDGVQGAENGAIWQALLDHCGN